MDDFSNRTRLPDPDPRTAHHNLLRLLLERISEEATAPDESRTPPPSGGLSRADEPGDRAHSSDAQQGDPQARLEASLLDLLGPSRGGSSKDEEPPERSAGTVRRFGPDRTPRDWSSSREHDRDETTRLSGKADGATCARLLAATYTVIGYYLDPLDAVALFDEIWDELHAKAREDAAIGDIYEAGSLLKDIRRELHAVMSPGIRP